MNILLTGGAGYIGSHVALSLLDNGHKVHIIDDLSTGNINLIPNNANFTECNVNEVGKISEIIKKNKFDALMHFAGFIKVEESVKYPEKYFYNNTKNSITLFNTCKDNNLNKIIFSSTASAYGNSKKNIVTENDKLYPQNPYAESKIKTEEYLMLHKEHFKFIILRYFNVAGADEKLRSGQVSKKSTHLIKILSEVAVGKKNIIEVYGSNYNTPDGTAIRDYIHVSDLADIHLEVTKYLLEYSKSDLFNCGYGKGFSVLDVINKANEIYQNKIKFSFSQKRDGDVEKLVSDISKLQKNIKWEPKYNDLAKIIKSSVNWEKKVNEQNF